MALIYHSKGNRIQASKVHQNIRRKQGTQGTKFFFFKVHSGTVKAFHISVNRTFDHNFTGGNVKLQALVLGFPDPWYQSFTDFSKHDPGSQQSIFLFHPQNPKVPLAIPSPGRCINKYPLKSRFLFSFSVMDLWYTTQSRIGYNKDCPQTFYPLA